MSVKSYMSIGTLQGRVTAVSLRHALLGLLAEEPASGFDLTKTVEQVLSPWAWHTTHTHVYPELRRMHGDGLVEVLTVASRGRKTYAITDSGRAELRRWLLTPPITEAVRNEAALRMFLISTLDRDEARTLLRRYADHATTLLERVRKEIDQASPRWRDNPLAVGRLAAERGLRVLPALRDWALWGIAQLDQVDTDHAQQTPPGSPELHDRTSGQRAPHSHLDDHRPSD
jgi:PadR family transcriptional regulator, regulatory protein AphA